MKTDEQKQHELEMKYLRLEFASLWRGELARTAKSLGVHPNMGCEHLAWIAFISGYKKNKTNC